MNFLNDFLSINIENFRPIHTSFLLKPFYPRNNLHPESERNREDHEQWHKSSSIGLGLWDIFKKLLTPSKWWTRELHIAWWFLLFSSKRALVEILWKTIVDDNCMNAVFLETQLRNIKIWIIFRNFSKQTCFNIREYLLCSGFEEKFLTSFEGSKGMLSWPGPFIPHMALFRRARLTGINNWLLKIIWKKFLISAIIYAKQRKTTKITILVIEKSSFSLIHPLFRLFFVTSW